MYTLVVLSILLLSSLKKVCEYDAMRGGEIAQLNLYGYFTCSFNTGRDAIRVFVYKKFFAKNIHFIFRILALCISCQKFNFESKYCAFTSILYINLAINRLVSGNWPITHYNTLFVYSNQYSLVVLVICYIHNDRKAVRQIHGNRFMYFSHFCYTFIISIIFKG